MENDWSVWFVICWWRDGSWGHRRSVGAGCEEGKRALETKEGFRLEEESTSFPERIVGGATTKVGDERDKVTIAKWKKENISNGNQWPAVAEEPKEVSTDYNN